MKVDELRERLETVTGDDHTDLPPMIGTFLRGLSLGALVGAAIAGSALLERWRRQKQAGATDRATGSGPPAS